jgi:antirestriction protein ArdC
MSGNLYELVTTKILDALREGVIPWKKPWHIKRSVPISLTTGKPYRGVNNLLLGIAPFSDHRWLTLRQVGELGGTLRKGERSTLVVFWKFPERSADEEETRRPAPILRYYKVFNVEQVEGLNLPELPKAKETTPKERSEKAELLIQCMPDPPEIREDGNSAWYKPSQDLIQLPKLEHFASSDQFYTTLFHEIGHSTGHAKRLNRSGVTEQVHFGSGEYSREELVAELTAAFCAGEVGLDNSFIADSASYIQSWLSVLRNDPKAVVIAAAQAQKAADYIKGVTYQT